MAMNRAIGRKMNLVNGSILALAAALLVMPTDAEAKIYKCTAADGGVSYNQQPCAATETTNKVMQGASVRDRLDCRVARSFSQSVAEAMKAGRTADDLFSQYGGLNFLTPTTVGVINYVYSHKGNLDTSVSRITALSGARCETGSYSRAIDCIDFPQEFIVELGGCQAVKGEVAQRRPKSDDNQDDDNYVPASDSDASQNSANRNQNYNVLQTSSADLQTQCRQRINAQITEIQDKMRGRLSVDEHNDLNNERRLLRDQHNDC